jgi:dTDP-4-dehydrorhamnose 3,5-epimerase
MDSVRLSNISVVSLSRIDVIGGDVLHAMKSGDVGFNGFGEAYFSWVYYGAVKAWKRHKQMTLNLVVPVGMVKLVFYSNNTDDSNMFLEEEIGVEKYRRVTVPPGIWFGIQGLGKPASLLLNIANINHDPREVEYLSQTSFNYQWSDS